MMQKSTIAFVTLFELTETYAQIARNLGDECNCVFVTSTDDTYERLLRLGVAADRILNVAATRAEVRRMGPAPEELKANIAKYETGDFTFPSIIMMSRFYMAEPYECIVHYMARTLGRMEQFFLINGVDWVITEPTNAVELLSFLVARKNGFHFGHFEFARLPSSRVMLFNEPQESEYYPLAEDSDPNASRTDRLAKEWLAAYRDKPDPPAYLATQVQGKSFLALIRSGTRQSRLFFKGLYGGNEANYHTFGELFDVLTRRYRAKLRGLAVGREKLLKANLPLGSYVVYFLHVQPERSIDVQSPWFCDQLNIIRAVRRATPSRIHVYVKDHPSATGAQRLAFYRGLRSVPGVQLLDARLASRGLILNAVLVATITGTVAYEAAILKIPALIFGKEFFRGLPYVFSSDSLPELPALMAEAVESRGRDIDPDDGQTLSFLDGIFRNSVELQWDGNAGIMPSEAVNGFTQLLLRAMTYQRSAKRLTYSNVD